MKIAWLWSAAVRAAVVMLSCLWGCEKSPPSNVQRAPAKPLAQVQPLLLAGPDGGTFGAAHEPLPHTPAVPELPKENRAVLALSGDDIDFQSGRYSPRDPVSLAALARAVGDVPTVVLCPDSDTAVFQISELFGWLDDSNKKVILAGPGCNRGFEVALTDEAAFQAWLAEAVPGKIRIIQRKDGFEVQTNVGKLPGPDRNGPSIPTRGGKLDIGRLALALQQLKGRFQAAPDLCIVPSFATELESVFAALTANATPTQVSVFSSVKFVYPRSGASAKGR